MCESYPEYFVDKYSLKEEGDFEEKVCESYPEYIVDKYSLKEEGDFDEKVCESYPEYLNNKNITNFRKKKKSTSTDYMKKRNIHEQQGSTSMNLCAKLPNYLRKQVKHNYCTENM